MKPVVISRKARADLREIGDFIAADNPRRAVTFIAELRSRLKSLSRSPMQGRPAPDIDQDLCILVFRPYLILHRVEDDRILIDRVVHSSRDRANLSSDD